jgi:L-alanine-DL-glutamate epimerase-like enolase superfamily enzyme
MPEQIVDYDIWRIELPVGRTIGDNMCRYSEFTVFVLALKTDQGHQGWGFGELVTDGVFQKPAPWYKPMASLGEIRSTFEHLYWPLLKDSNSMEIKNRRPSPFGSSDYIHMAIRKSLWDLMGKEADLPLHRLLGSTKENNHVRAYGSPLAFHQSDEDTLEMHQHCVNQGMTAVKVKVGHSDPEWDVRRLQLVRQAVGPSVEINIDANIAWTAQEAIERIETFRRAGIELGYVEDPIRPDDVEGYRLLGQELPIDVAGHDYISDPEGYRPLLDVGGIQRLRFHDDLDHAIAVSRLGEEYNLPVIGCNTLFEVGIHAAVALPNIERIEFADLGWNTLPEHPVRVEDGCMFAPDRPGAGLEPKLELLEELSCSQK